MSETIKIGTADPNALTNRRQLEVTVNVKNLDMIRNFIKRYKRRRWKLANRWRRG